MEKGKVVSIYGGRYRVISLVESGALVVQEPFIEGVTVFPNPVLFIDAETIEKEGEVE